MDIYKRESKGNSLPCLYGALSLFGSVVKLKLSKLYALLLGPILDGCTCTVYTVSRLQS